jgi:hypothetical protein
LQLCQFFLTVFKAAYPTNKKIQQMSHFLGLRANNPTFLHELNNLKRPYELGNVLLLPSIIHHLDYLCQVLILIPNIIEDLV